MKFIFDLGLAELGPQLVKLYVLPRVKTLSARLDSVLERMSSSNADKIAATQIKNLLIVCYSIFIFIRFQTH